ncbi:MAG: hypothetical protein HY067_18165 [Betaproteobacteria bacterium]|nr:hypothetical protein [Betaproteobacteria bacterium]
MMLHEPMLMPHLQDRDPLKVAVTLLVIIGVLAAGFLVDRHRKQAAPESSRETL